MEIRSQLGGAVGAACVLDPNLLDRLILPQVNLQRLELLAMLIGQAGQLPPV